VTSSNYKSSTEWQQ